MVDAKLMSFNCDVRCKKCRMVLNDDNKSLLNSDFCKYCLPMKSVEEL